MRKFFLTCLATLMVGVSAWGYRVSDNYTIETKFKINAVGAGLAFRVFEGFGGSICMWQFNVGQDGTKSLFRPHDWKVGGILLGEIDTRNYGVTLNTTDWFVTKIVVSDNGTHADTYLRKADDDIDVLIDSRDGNFRFGMVGTRQDHDGNTNESASYDYFKITDDDSGRILYYEDFETTDGNWQNDPIWENGTITTEGRNLSEVKYFPKNMFLDAVDMHYAVDADVYIEEGFLSLVFGIGENGSNYMWQLSPWYENQNRTIIYYHLDNGNENWKAHAASANFPDFDGDAFLNQWHHVTIKVDGNIVNTYIDGKLQNSFVQCDMTDLERLNDGGVGLRADGSNNATHRGKVDNLTLTHFDAEGNILSVDLFDNFAGESARYLDVELNPLTYIEDEAFCYDVPAGNGNAFRLLQSEQPYEPLVLSEIQESSVLPAPLTTDVKTVKTLMANQWNTLGVPFNLTAEQIADIFGANTKVAAFKNVVNNVINFELATSVEAGVPYLINPEKAPTSFTADLTISQSAPLSVGEGNIQFVGTYGKQALLSDGTNLLLQLDGSLKKPAEGEEIKGLSAFFAVPENTEVSISVEGSVLTGISEMRHTFSGDSLYYDLMGRATKAPSKGIYLNKNKKVVIR